ncbi:MAG TPA: pyridoxamine 5'-phosphate oxidase family protein [Segeticoccus sp.]|uniref:pyridoxamine 5'-phosphate oxidase family protein n=1 Tax=Segeticoccus sp. TaxID=2706531 RepID=UPI002D7FBD20|nr:pyridoxamine 5'-phosphate oxidase family protein [Segeticoccus sp.]HET8600337.1 pyridoxamine 5'-phosphate oxidase family protein [Segeticoccus sp.]
MRTELTRLPEKGVTDRGVLHALLDEALVAHVGLVAEGQPVVIPTAMARDGDHLLIHGSTGSRWMRALAAGAPASVAVTALDGLVVARSAFESSVHYRSAVLFGRFHPVVGTEKAAALTLLTDALIPGRSREVRESTAKELAATLVLALPIERWSLKVSDGWPEDEEDDVAGPAWAGVVPIRRVYEAPEPAPDLGPGRPVPASVRALTGGGATNPATAPVGTGYSRAGE